MLPVRDLVLIGAVLALLPVCVRRPYVGVLVWTWISFMNPHRLTWGPAYDMPFAQYVAIATLLGVPFARDRRPIPLTRETLALATFWALTFLSTIFSLYPAWAWLDFERFSKILLMTFVTLMFVHDRARLHLLLVVAALSVGFYGLKGGTWGLFVSQGMYRVWGPAGSFIEDNNALALALNMTLPLLFYLAREEPRRWRRLVLQAIFGLSIVSVVLTYSRGGLVGLGAVLSVLILQSRWRVRLVGLILAMALGLASFLPEQWFDRMATIAEYETDGSALARIAAWNIGWNVALDYPVLGGGFRVFPQPEIWARYAPDWTFKTYNAHSVYFQILGEHGFTGLALFATLVVFLFVSLRSVSRMARRRPGVGWAADYAAMVQASLIGFLASGIFLNLAYFDLFYFLVAVAIVLRRLVTGPEAATVSAPARHATPAAVPVRFLTRPGW
jgi:probable O-glycosylation ligase (exosortase A-associated)